MTPPNPSSQPQPDEDYRKRYEKLTGHSLRQCPVCHRGRMITVKLLATGHSPPAIPDTSGSIRQTANRCRPELEAVESEGGVVLQAFRPPCDQPSIMPHSCSPKPMN